MSKPSLDDLKKWSQEKKEKKNDNTTKKSGESDYYPFWQIGDDETASVRVLPIANQKKAIPFIEKDHHKLSIDGKDETIPCIAMYGEVCPICELSRKYYKIAKQEKDPTKKEEAEKMGKYYYRSRSFLASAYIKKDPLPRDSETDENYEGKVKVIQFGNQLYKKFDTSLENLINQDELDDVPWSLENGLDFNIVKKQGNSKWAEWDLASDFARRTSSLPADFIESFQPADLTKFLPANPGLDKVQRMLDAHMNDGSYSDDDSSTRIEKEPEAPKRETTNEVVEKPAVIKEETSTTSDSDADDITAMLRMLKNRQTEE